MGTPAMPGTKGSADVLLLGNSYGHPNSYMQAAYGFDGGSALRGHPWSLGALGAPYAPYTPYAPQPQGGQQGIYGYAAAPPWGATIAPQQTQQQTQPPQPSQQQQPGKQGACTSNGDVAPPATWQGSDARVGSGGGGNQQDALAWNAAGEQPHRSTSSAQTRRREAAEKADSAAGEPSSYKQGSSWASFSRASYPSMHLVGSQKETASMRSFAEASRRYHDQRAPRVAGEEKDEYLMRLLRGGSAARPAPSTGFITQDTTLSDLSYRPQRLPAVSEQRQEPASTLSAAEQPVSQPSQPAPPPCFASPAPVSQHARPAAPQPVHPTALHHSRLPKPGVPAELRARLGDRTFYQMRSLILRHQETFISQIFELHRVAGLQKHLQVCCERPDLLHAALLAQQQQDACRRGEGQPAPHWPRPAGPAAQPAAAGWAGQQLPPAQQVAQAQQSSQQQYSAAYSGGAAAYSGGAAAQAAAHSQPQQAAQQAGHAAQQQQLANRQQQAVAQVQPAAAAPQHHHPAALQQQPYYPPQALPPGTLYAPAPVQYAPPAAPAPALVIPPLAALSLPHGCGFGPPRNSYALPPAAGMFDPMAAWYAHHYGRQASAAPSGGAATPSGPSTGPAMPSQGTQPTRSGAGPAAPAMEPSRWWQDPAQVFGPAAVPEMVARTELFQPSMSMPNPDEVDSVTKPHSRAPRAAAAGPGPLGARLPLKHRVKRRHQVDPEGDQANDAASMGGARSAADAPAGSKADAAPVRRVAKKARGAAARTSRAESIGSENSKSSMQRDRCESSSIVGSDKQPAAMKSAAGILLSFSSQQ